MPPPPPSPKPKRRPIMRMSMPQMQMPSVFYVKGDDSEQVSPAKVAIGAGLLVLLSVGLGVFIGGRK